MRFLRTARDPGRLSPGEVEALVSRLPAVCRQYGVVLMYLHGSHARGEQGSLSDLDLAALLDDRTAGVLQVELELLGALQRASGREDIDLVILNRAGPIIKDRVVRYGRLIWARHEQDRVYFEERAIKEALDFGYFSRQYDQALFQQLREGERLG